MTLHVLYGGTFDPVHNGHLAIARAARDELNSPILLMPAADPPHREPPGASAEQRAAMLELALQGERDLRIDLRELERARREPEARSYTIDTLRELRAELGADVPVALLIGADSFLNLPTWKAWRELFDFAHIVIAERPGIALDGMPSNSMLPAELRQVVADRWTDSVIELKLWPAGRVLRLHQPLHEESASEVRERIAAGANWPELLPAPVVGYIRARHLYAAR